MDESSLEVLTALQAIRLASQLCQSVRGHLTRNQSIQKSDRSPVTIADYGSQAIICKLIRDAFPEDIIIAEEDSSELRKGDHAEILEHVRDYVSEIFPGTSSDEVCSWIDLSTHTIKSRFWALDPIDGTKGFLRGDQYAIALALIENGRIELGLMGCPNLYLTPGQRHEKRGCLFFALRGKGSFQFNLEGKERRTLSVSTISRPEDASFTESVEPDHADHETHVRVAKRLGMVLPPIKMDSQAKYGIVARGEATFYLRVPASTEPEYKEKVWDHAAGVIIAEEAGGKVTDLHGQPLDFSCGITLERNEGILVSNGILHEVVLKALEI